jgi:hypothetical protein
MIGIGVGVIAAGALLLAAASGCRPTAVARGIDPPAVERQLERVLTLRLVAGHFYGKTVTVSCLGNGDDLHLICHVSAGETGKKTLEWDEFVSCNPPPDKGIQRCYTDSGEALQ